MKAKIYTKTGDRGTTGTFYGRMSKSDDLASALGSLDELNCWIGICRLEVPGLDKELMRMQENLLTIGSVIAGSGLRMGGRETTHLERLIDKMTDKLPKLDTFILPVGYLHVTRTVARRGERAVITAGITDKNILKYLNRLSDALFTMARWVHTQAGMPEKKWKGRK